MMVICWVLYEIKSLKPQDLDGIGLGYRIEASFRDFCYDNYIYICKKNLYDKDYVSEEEANKMMTELLSLLNGDIIDLRNTDYIIDTRYCGFYEPQRVEVENRMYDTREKIPLLVKVVNDK